MSWSTKLIQSDAGQCPECGMALDLYARPVNIREYVCCACNSTFSDEYIAGFVTGFQKASEQSGARKYIKRHKDWSLSTFGEGQRTEGLCKHISKELDEIRQSPNDLMEWIDVIILALDGAWRAGYSPMQIVNALVQKQAINFDRKWVRASEGEPTEHQRT